ncbi:MAG: hypothetical protein JW803_08085 [Endomicrobiales bacterium]|nr:hypothetical protein [Endomicrobiales bacterium]
MVYEATPPKVVYGIFQYNQADYIPLTPFPQFSNLAPAHGQEVHTKRPQFSVTLKSGTDISWARFIIDDEEYAAVLTPNPDLKNVIATFTPSEDLSEGPHTVYVRAANDIGLEDDTSAAPHTFTIKTDFTAPSVTITDQAGRIVENNDILNTYGSIQFAVYANDGDDGTGLALLEYYKTGEPPVQIAAEFIPDHTYYLTLGEGEWNIKSYDKAGNVTHRHFIVTQLSNDNKALVWPIKPFDQQHEVIAVLGQYMVDGDGDAYMHNGDDITDGVEGQAVYAECNSYVISMGDDYITYGNSSDGGFIITVSHIVPNANLHVGSYVKYYNNPNGPTILGATGPGGFVHYTQGWYDPAFVEEHPTGIYQGLLGAVYPYFNPAFPVINEVKYMERMADGSLQEYDTVINGRTVISGNLVIVCDDYVQNAFLNPGIRLPVGGHMYVINTRTQNEWKSNYTFDGDYSHATVDDFYAPGTVAGASPVYKMWVTNNMDHNNYADTREYVDGNCEIKIAVFVDRVIGESSNQTQNAEDRFVIDNHPPVISSFTYSGNPMKISCRDEGVGIDPATLVMKLDNVDVPGYFNEQDNLIVYNFDPALISSGSHSIYVSIKDKIERESEKQWNFFIDVVKPATEFQTDLQNPVIDSMTYVNFGTVITLTGSDPNDNNDGSGVAETYCSIDNGDWSAYVSGFSFDEAGEHTVSYYSVDNVGNVEDVKTITVFLDDSAPVISLEVGQPKHESGGKIIVSDETLFTLSGTDEYSGIKEMKWQVSESTSTAPEEWNEYGAPFALSAQDSGKVIWYGGIDNVGNESYEFSGVIVVDTAAPQVAITSPKGGAKYYTGASTMTISYAVTDDLDPSPASNAYLKNAGTGVTASVYNGQTVDLASFTPGMWNFTAEAQDFAGNISSATTADFEILPKLETEAVINVNFAPNYGSLPPQITINSPADRSKFIAGQSQLNIAYNLIYTPDPTHTVLSYLTNIASGTVIDAPQGSVFDPSVLDAGFWRFTVKINDGNGATMYSANSVFEVIHELLPEEASITVSFSPTGYPVPPPTEASISCSFLPDYVPPALITDFTAVHLSASSVLLSWTAPGDDGAEGTLTNGKFELKLSTDAAFGAFELVSISTDTFAGARFVQEVTAAAGQEKPSYFAVRARDNAGNWTDWSSAVFENSAPFAPALIYPIEDALVNGATTVLSWEVPADYDGDGLHFKVEFSETVDFSTSTIYESGADPAGFEPAPPLVQGEGLCSFTIHEQLADTTYYWRVAARDGSVYGNYSEIRKFYVNSAPPRMVSAAAVAVDGIMVQFSEDLADGTIDASDFSVEGFGVTGATETAPGAVLLTVSEMPTDANPWVVIVSEISNLIGSYAVIGSSVQAADNIPPKLLSITVTPDPVSAPPNQFGAGTVQFTAVFSESMDSSGTPTVRYDPVGIVEWQDCADSPAWSETNKPNDTYTVFNSMSIRRATGDGSAVIEASGGKDAYGNLMGADQNNSFFINMRVLSVIDTSVSVKTFNPELGETCVISYVLTEPAQEVEVVIKTDGGIPVRTLSDGEAQSEGQHKYAWDGRDDGGSLVLDGDYTCEVSARNVTPVFENDERSLRLAVDRSKPVIKNVVDAPDPLQIGGSSAVSFEVAVPAPAGDYQARLQVLDSVGVVVYDSAWVTNAAELVWDCAGSPEGIYEYTLRARDLADKSQRANPVRGTITIQDLNTAVSYSPDLFVELWHASSFDVDITTPAAPQEAVYALEAVPNVFVVSRIYDLNPLGGFVAPAVMIFNYDPALDGSKLMIHRFDGTNWKPVAAQYADLANNRIIAELYSCSLYALFSLETAVKPPAVDARYSLNPAEPSPVNAVSVSLSGKAGLDDLVHCYVKTGGAEYPQEPAVMTDDDGNFVKEGVVLSGADGLILEIYAKAEDYSGAFSTESVKQYLLLDTQAPQIAVTSPKGGDVYSAGVADLGIVFTVEDGLDPAPLVSAYLSDLEEGTTLQVSNGQVIDPFEIDDGLWAMTVSAIDWAGNAVSTTTASFEVVHDSVPPQSQLQVAGCRFELDGRTYVNGVTSFTITAEDPNITEGTPGSGIAVIDYKVDETIWQPYVNPFTLGIYGEGEHVIQYRATDNAGNRETEQMFSVILDTTAPLNQLKVESCKVNVEDILFANSDRTFEIHAEDPLTFTIYLSTHVLGSGVKEISYSIVNTSYSIYSSQYVVENSTFSSVFVTTFVVTGIDGRYLINYGSKDNVENASIVSSATVVLDNTKPQTQFAVQGSQFIDDGKTYVNGAHIVELSANDPTVNDSASGVEHTFYALDMTTGIYSGAISGLAEGLHAFSYYSLDKANNAEIEQSRQVAVDVTAPQSQLTVNSEQLTDNGKATAKPGAPITITATDPTSGVVSGSGVKETLYSMYKVDGSTTVPEDIWQVYTGTFTITEEGTYVIKYYSKDNVDNGEAVKTCEITVSYLFSCRLIGIEKVTINGWAQVSGELRSNGLVRVDGRSQVNGDVYADKVKITKWAKVTGEVHEDAPAVNPEPLDIETILNEARANNDNEKIPDLGRRRKAVNRRGELVLTGSDSLVLSTGTYFFTGVNIAARASLGTDGKVTIVSCGDIKIAGKNNVNYSGLPDDLVIYAGVYRAKHFWEDDDEEMDLKHWLDAREYAEYLSFCKDDDDDDDGFDFRRGRIRCRRKNYPRTANIYLAGITNINADIYAPGSKFVFAGWGDMKGTVFVREAKLSGRIELEGYAEPETMTAAKKGKNALGAISADPEFVLHETYSYPNPAKEGKKPIIHIECGLADSVSVRIYNVAAELVHEASIDGGSAVIKNNAYCYEYPWDVTDTASGVYIYVIRAEKSGKDAIKVIKKLAVIK